jgi:SAM-dependent methyltransferase
MPTAEDYVWTEQVCPVCGTLPKKFIGIRGGTTHRAGFGVETKIWRCESCDLVLPNPMPFPKGGVSQHYSMAPDEYFVLHDAKDKVANCERILQEAERLVSIGKLLDIGSGRGEMAATALRRGWNVTCLEPSPVFAKALREKGLQVAEQTVENLNGSDGKFDVVILAAVLEHLYNPAEVVSAIGCKLRAGGILYLDVPNEAGLFFKLGNLYNKIRRTGATVNISPTFSPFHVFGYSKRAVIKLLAAYGLQPVRLTVHVGAIPLPRRSGLRGRIESLGVKTAKVISAITGQGAHMDLWARKS